MNLLKLLQDINYQAFRFIKMQELKVKSHFYKKKINAKITEFMTTEGTDIPMLAQPDYKDSYDFAPLNQYLRSHFDEKYPRCIESFQRVGEDVYAHLFTLILSGHELTGYYNGNKLVNFFSLDGVPHTYAISTMLLDDYAECREELTEGMASNLDSVDTMKARYTYFLDIE